MLCQLPETLQAVQAVFPDGPCVSCWSFVDPDGEMRLRDVQWIAQDHTVNSRASNLGQIFRSLMQSCSTCLILTNLKLTIYQSGIYGGILLFWNSPLSLIHTIFFDLFFLENRNLGKAYVRILYWRILKWEMGCEARQEAKQPWLHEKAQPGAPLHVILPAKP